MKVYELINKLQNCDLNADVEIVFDGCWHDIRDIETVKCEETSTSVVEIHAWN